MSQAIDDYFAKRSFSYKLNHYSGVITGYGRTEALAKADAERQAKMVKIKLPKNFNKLTSDALPNAEKTKSRYYKHRSKDGVRWHKAISMVIEKIGIGNVAQFIGTNTHRVYAWSKKLSLPPENNRDRIIDLLIKHLTRSDLVLCNIDIPEKESLRHA